MPELNDQNFYYRDLRGRLLGNKAREEFIAQHLHGLKRDDFFLEVGCAQGHFEGIASSFCENVFGSDFAFEKMHGAKLCLPQCDFLGVNAERLPFRRGSFDFVLCTEVLEHVPDWKGAFAELQRVSRGKILVTVPLEKGYFWRALSKFRAMETRGHLHRLDSRDLRGCLCQGWRVAMQKIVATPSRRLNRLIGGRAREKIGMYSMLLLEKGNEPPLRQPMLPTGK